MKTLSTVILILTGMILHAQTTESIYYFATGWESQPQTERAKKFGEKPLITNVVQLNYTCLDNATEKVEQRLSEFYKINNNTLNAGYGALTDVKAVGPFKTFQEAQDAFVKKKVEFYKRFRIITSPTDFWILCPKK